MGMIMEKLKRFWQPFIWVNGDDKTRITVSLHIIIPAMLVATIFYAFFAPITQEKIWLRFVYVAPTLLFLYGLLYALRRGYIRFTAIAVITFLWGLISIASYTSNFGIYSPAYTGYLMVVVCAGLLLGQFAVYLVVIASILVGGILVYNEATSGATFIPPATSLWVTQTIYLIITAVILTLTLRHLSHALEQLQKGEARLQALLSAIPDIIFELTQDGTFLRYIPAKNMGTLIPPEQFLGKKITEVMPPTVSTPALLAIEQVTQAGGVQVIEYQLPVDNGLRDYECRIVMTGPDTVLAMVRDITRRKQMETALKEEHNFRTSIIEYAAEGLCVYHPIQEFPYVQFTVWNKRMEEITGYTIHQINQSGWYQTVYTTPELQEKAKERLRLILDGDQMRSESKNIIRADGQKRVINATTSLLHSSDGLIHVMGLVEDITEQKRVEAEREDLIQELKTKNEELERFTYTVSHDLKSPLITIRGFLGFVEKDALSGNMERLKADIKRIVEATNKMHELLEDLLTLSRIGRLTTPPQLVPFEDLVREALLLVSGLLEEQKTQVVVMPDLPMVYGDRSRLIEMLQNLIDNAAKFMGNQPEPCIQIGAVLEGEETRFFVRDNGIGIEPSFQERIFGLFERLDTTTDGTGIGLAVVKRIVEVHNGRIWAESAGKEKGSTFYFTLPDKP